MMALRCYGFIVLQICCYTRLRTAQRIINKRTQRLQMFPILSTLHFTFSNQIENTNTDENHIEIEHIGNVFILTLNDDVGSFM